MRSFLTISIFVISTICFSNSFAQYQNTSDSLFLKKDHSAAAYVYENAKIISPGSLNDTIPNDSTDIERRREDSLFLRSVHDVKESGSSTLPIAIGVLSFIYLFNPIILFENDKIALGFTKEISLGFGKFGQHRVSFEYSYIFRKDLNSHIRFAYKYDILLKNGIEPSNLLQGTPTLTIGGGYFNNFSRPGYFAESSYGYSIRNDKILFYPSLKLRYTYIVQGSNIVDVSFGLIIGIANPFIDLKIRRKY